IVSWHKKEACFAGVPWEQKTGRGVISSISPLPACLRSSPEAFSLFTFLERYIFSIVDALQHFFHIFHRGLSWIRSSACISYRTFCDHMFLLKEFIFFDSKVFQIGNDTKTCSQLSYRLDQR